MLTGIVCQFARQEVHGMVQDPGWQLAVATVGKRESGWEIRVVGAVTVGELF